MEMVGMITCLTRITLCICLWFAVIVPCLAQEDPYPAYLAQLAVEITTAGNTPTQNFAYWGTQKDAAGWTDYYLVNLADPNLGRKLIIHVPLPGAKLSAAMIGDSTIDKIAFDQVMPDVATLNAGLGGEHCWGTLARLGEIAALKPSVIVVGCGNSDVYTVGTAGVTPEMSESEAALVNIMSEAKSLRFPIIVATLTPILSTLPTEPTMTPSVVAQRIRTFNTWLRADATASGVQFWNRWSNIAASTGNWGVPMCYNADCIHPVNCGQMEVGGLRYLISGEGGKTD